MAQAELELTIIPQLGFKLMVGSALPSLTLGHGCKSAHSAVFSLPTFISKVLQVLASSTTMEEGLRKAVSSYKEMVSAKAPGWRTDLTGEHLRDESLSSTPNLRAKPTISQLHVDCTH